MPPKKAAGASKKADNKKKDKIIEDKTFGLKNKNKSKSVQKYIKGVQAQVKGGQADQRAIEKKKQQEQEAERKRLEAQLFKPAVVATQKVPLGVDPKSILCEFFKKGVCTKGAKCKFSHNLEIEKKSPKIDIYTDKRKEEDTMDSWDQNKLESVVESKQGNVNKNLKTTIVCKYFIEAIENKKYGWFWECPNGGDKCQYRHALPPGYVLKSDKKKEEVEEIPIEEKIEEQRAMLKKRTPLTLELFKKWLEDKEKKRELQEKELLKKREQDIKSGKLGRSGREMFEFNPDLVKEEDEDEDSYFDTSQFKEEIDGPIHVIEATGTSLKRTTLNAENESSSSSMTTTSTTTTPSTNVEMNGMVKEIEESLFIEDEIPDEEED